MSSTAQQVGTMLIRELTSLKAELVGYGSEADIWRVAPGISNSAGNLTLHLVGNLQHFIGATLGQSGYIRNRDAEFSSKDVPRVDLIRLIDDTIAVVDRTAKALGPADLGTEYPEPVAKVHLNTGDFLIHLAAHLAYHLGQVDYHRRIITASATTVGTVAPGRLHSARPAE